MELHLCRKRCDLWWLFLDLSSKLDVSLSTVPLHMSKVHTHWVLRKTSDGIVRINWDEDLLDWIIQCMKHCYGILILIQRFNHPYGWKLLGMCCYGECRLLFKDIKSFIIVKIINLMICNLLLFTICKNLYDHDALFNY